MIKTIGTIGNIPQIIEGVTNTTISTCTPGPTLPPQGYDGSGINPSYIGRSSTDESVQFLDGNGQPLANVNLYETSNPTNGSTSDAQGFAIVPNIAPGAKLTASYVGKKTFTNTLDYFKGGLITLQDDPESLDTIEIIPPVTAPVETGISTKKKYSLTVISLLIAASIIAAVSSSENKPKLKKAKGLNAPAKSKKSKSKVKKAKRKTTKKSKRTTVKA